MQRNIETAWMEIRKREEIAIRSTSGTILHAHVRDKSRQLDRILQEEVNWIYWSLSVKYNLIDDLGTKIKQAHLFRRINLAFIIHICKNLGNNFTHNIIRHNFTDQFLSEKFNF